MMKSGHLFIRKRSVKIVAVFLSLLLLTGCWDRLELTEVGIITALAIDKNPETGEYILSAQYLRPAALSAVAPSPVEPFIVITSKGTTVSELIRKADQNVGRNGFYAHNKVVIVSEEVAKDGLLNLFETFQRDKRVRSYVWVAVAKGTMARTFLEKKVKSIASVPANFLNSLFISAKTDAVTHNLLNFYKKSLKEGIDPVLGVLSFDKAEELEEESIKLTGGAVFQQDSFVGFLNETEAMAYNWVRTESTNKSQGTFKVPMDDGSIISLRLISKKAKIIPTIKGEEPITFTIELNQETQLVEQVANRKFTSNQEVVEYVNKVKETTEKQVEEDIMRLVEKTQTELRSDILGFGETIHKKNPKVWHKIKENWQENYPNTKVEVKVNVTIKNAGLIKGELAPGEQ
ncbi:Ger(x)C family spore germination protein [Gracilibacillus dipsosauri]|uniref:Ger(X)C family spore germination protein n=1 Tax=Gracilibacillus dipsosauri TaxID=178340 RepID=A0A317L2H9_9BACI|nr:Ger(x)C family spore germination protein [Gracilibacillus dipsosauri]PWU69723.1 hypothetical protein DLJ74_01995 [Gracilibacillus dipsosauri]